MGISIIQVIILLIIIPAFIVLAKLIMAIFRIANSLESINESLKNNTQKLEKSQNINGK